MDDPPPLQQPLTIAIAKVASISQKDQRPRVAISPIKRRAVEVDLQYRVTAIR